MFERFERKRSLGFRFADGDPLWSVSNVRQYAFIAVFVGMGAGALGKIPLHARVGVGRQGPPTIARWRDNSFFFCLVGIVRTLETSGVSC